MGSFPIKLGSKLYTFKKIRKYLSAPNICFAKYCINRHQIVFIQNEHEIFAKLQANDMDRFPLNAGTQPYIIHNFLKSFASSN